MTYDNIRHPALLGTLIGQRVLDITQTDTDAMREEGQRVFLHFEGGVTIGFAIDEVGFTLDGIEVDDDEDDEPAPEGPDA